MKTLIQAALAFICRHSFLRSPFLAALLFRASLHRIGRRSGSERYTALMMPRPGLREDALAVLEDMPEFSVLSTYPGIMKAIAAGFLPVTIDDNNYANLSAEEEAAKQRYRAFLQDVMRHLLKLVRIDVIVSGNFAYFAERELHAAAEALGVPFIVLHKENLKTPARAAFFTQHYRRRRGAFGGREVLVYNDIEREVQINAGVVPAERIEVCGMPRLDRCHAWRRASAGRSRPEQPTMLFFTFGAKTGLPVLRRKGAEGDYSESLPEFDNLDWHNTVQETMQAIAGFARTHPHVRVVVKSKLSSSQIEIFRVAAGGHIPPNLELIDGGDPLDLLQEAWAVVGMNSTALLEALAMDAVVICPAYAEAADPDARQWIVDLGSAIEYARSPDQLIARLSQIASGPAPIVAGELGAGAANALRHWAGNADGKASERVGAAILREMKTARHRSEHEPHASPEAPAPAGNQTG